MCARLVSGVLRWRAIRQLVQRPVPDRRSFEGTRAGGVDQHFNVVPHGRDSECAVQGAQHRDLWKDDLGVAVSAPNKILVGTFAQAVDEDDLGLAYTLQILLFRAPAAVVFVLRANRTRW